MEIHAETGPVNRPGGGRGGDARALAFLALVTAALFRKALFGGGVILSHPVFLDLTHQIYAWRRFGFGCLREGVLPLWNPYSFCGTPFVANWHSAMFYPLNAVFLLLPAHTALNWSIAFHFFLAAAFTYAFARLLFPSRAAALLSALAFVFSGPYLVQLFPGHIFNPLPWLPLSLLLAELAFRRGRLLYFVLGGVVLAVQVLAGHPQYMLYCAGALVLYLLFRALAACLERRTPAPLGFLAAGLALLFLIGFTLSAVQLFPSVEFAGQSGRALLRGPESVADISFPPENAVTLLDPFFFGDMRASRYWGRWLFWETCLYVGILPLVLAIAGASLRRSRHAFFFAALALLSLVLSLGAYSPLFKFLYYHVPGFNLFRGQAKFISLSSFSLAILAGYGCSVAARPCEGERAALRRFGVAVLACALLLAVLCAAAREGGGERSLLWRKVLSYRATRGFAGTPPLASSDAQGARIAFEVALRGLAAAAFFMGFSGALLLVAARARMRPAALGAAVIALSLADLWRYGAPYIITSPLASCFWPPGLAAFFKADRSTFRICTPNISLPGATQNMNEGVCAVDGYETLNVGAYKEYVDYSQGVKSEERLTFAVGVVTPMIAELNLKYVVLPSGEPFGSEGYSARWTDGRITVHEKRHVAPRTYVARRAVVIRERSAALSELKSRAARGEGAVVLESAPAEATLDGGERGGSEAAARIARESVNEVVIEAELPQPGFLVLRDVFCPGWKAYDNGREQPVLRADWAFRAVYCDAGRHEVRFRYEPRSFALGARVSVVGLLAVACLLPLALRRRPRPGGAAVTSPSPQS